MVDVWIKNKQPPKKHSTRNTYTEFWKIDNPLQIKVNFSTNLSILDVPFSYLLNIQPGFLDERKNHWSDSDEKIDGGKGVKIKKNRKFDESSKGTVKKNMENSWSTLVLLNFSLRQFRCKHPGFLAKILA